MKQIQRMMMLDISATQIVGVRKYLEKTSILTISIWTQKRMPASTMIPSIRRSQTFTNPCSAFMLCPPSPFYKNLSCGAQHPLLMEEISSSMRAVLNATFEQQTDYFFVSNCLILGIMSPACLS